MSIVALEAGDSAGTGAARPTGVARLSKMMFDGVDLRPLWSELVGRYVYRQDDAAALLDLAILDQLFGNPDAGLARQAEALRLCRLYRSPFIGGAPALRLLALVAAGESDANRAVLGDIARLTARWPRAVLNPPEQIASLSRERLCRLLQDIPGLRLPPTARIARARLAPLAAGASLADILAGTDFPLIARPLDSHAGRGLEKLADAAALEGYLAARSESQFFVSPFVDYRDRDIDLRARLAACRGERGDLIRAGLGQELDAAIDDRLERLPGELDELSLNQESAMRRPSSADQ
jgi:hypothetical protein